VRPCRIYDELWTSWIEWAEVLATLWSSTMALQELKLHSPVGGESIVLQWPLSEAVSKTVSELVTMLQLTVIKRECFYPSSRTDNTRYFPSVKGGGMICYLIYCG